MQNRFHVVDMSLRESEGFGDGRGSGCSESPGELFVECLVLGSQSGDLFPAGAYLLA